MNTVAQPMYEWNTIPWHKAEREVFKLQKRIYQAASRGDTKAVHKLQRLLMKSWWAILSAVRRVTQDNQGKKTAGIDGVKSLNPKQRLKLALKLKEQPFSTQAKPVRRVWIPKPGTPSEKRGLGIPVMEDRARQALAKLALEPEWEAKFEPNSYGFRPGRGCHDAIDAIYGTIHQISQYVLDADIAKCFDRINHQTLLRKLKTFSRLRQVIQAWLRAGIMEGESLFASTEGTPQGGVVSPLLANIALHGLETEVVTRFSRKWNKKKTGYSGGRMVRPKVIRYADDFLVLEDELEVLLQIKEFVGEWLAEMGLELKPSKTRLTHTFKEYEGKVGFDFLGFTIRQFPAGKAKSARSTRGKVLGFNTSITPSKEAVQRHQRAIAAIIDKFKNAPQYALIKRLNPVIKGWSNYYSTVCSSYIFAENDHLVYQKLRAWANFRHSNKGQGWVANKYWRPKDHWKFVSGTLELETHRATPIRRHIKVRGNKSPYDGDWVYGTTRMGKHPDAPKRVANLLKRQKGKCDWCELYFRDGDKLEQDHITPLKLGGKDVMSNLQLLHRHCHDTKTATDLKRSRVVLNDKQTK
jgi:RNA-directed DNA polymerase